MSEFDNNNEFPEPLSEQPETPKSDTMLDSPKMVSPSRGFYWLERGLSDVVMPQFSKWFMAGLVYAALVIIAALIDQRLSLVIGVLNPIFMGGAILGAHMAYQKQAIPPSQLFKAFAHKNKLALVLYAVLQLILIFIAGYILMSLIGLETLQSIDMNKFQDPKQQAYQAEVFQQLVPAIKPAILIGLIFFFMTWFAPSLILLQDQNPLLAVSKGFFAALKNILAFLVFIVVFIIIMLVIGLIIMLISSLLSAISPTGSQIVINLALTAVMVPVLAATAYIGYREIFLGDAGQTKEPLDL